MPEIEFCWFRRGFVSNTHTTGRFNVVRASFPGASTCYSSPDAHSSLNMFRPLIVGTFEQPTSKRVKYSALDSPLQAHIPPSRKTRDFDVERNPLARYIPTDPQLHSSDALGCFLRNRRHVRHVLDLESHVNILRPSCRVLLCHERRPSFRFHPDGAGRALGSAGAVAVQESTER